MEKFTGKVWVLDDDIDTENKKAFFIHTIFM